MKISWISEKIGINKAGPKGSGLFAKKNIKKGDLIGVMGGYVVSLGEFKRMSKRSNAFKVIQHYAYHIANDLLFGPVHQTEVSELEHLNHSCEPNAGFKGEIRLVAMRDIQKGQEVTMDYATCVTSSFFNMKCLCGSKSCRKFITGNDWKKKVLQKKYRGFFQPYIAEKIKKQ